MIEPPVEEGQCELWKVGEPTLKVLFMFSPILKLVADPLFEPDPAEPFFTGARTITTVPPSVVDALTVAVRVCP